MMGNKVSPMACTRVRGSEVCVLNTTILNGIAREVRLLCFFTIFRAASAFAT